MLHSAEEEGSDSASLSSLEGDACVFWCEDAGMESWLLGSKGRSSPSLVEGERKLCE